MANYVLEILDGDRAGDVLPVTDRALRIGRKPGNDLVLADEKTSGVHAEVVLEGDRHVLRDLGSTNGTFLDGKRVTEIVLSPGDVVTVGRLRVKFRTEGDAAGSVEGAGELAVHRLDANRIRRRGGSVVGLAAIAVLGLGAGGWFWWQGQAAGPAEGAAVGLRRDPLVVAGNRLAAGVAGCESEAGWQLRAAGAGFQPTGQAHTGTGALEARRGDGAETPDFALLQLAEPLPVFTDRTMTLAAHVWTEGGALVGLRAHLLAQSEAVPFRFRTGTKLAAVTGWQRLELQLAVPQGCDRLQLEVIGVLPTAAAVVAVDDVAVTEAGTATALALKLSGASADGGASATGVSGQTALGTGEAFALRSSDADNLAILLGVEPEQVPAELQGLHQAGLCCLSDLGGTIRCIMGERGFELTTAGVPAVSWVMPAEAAGGLLVTGADGAFATQAAESPCTTSSWLLGDRLTRSWWRSEAPLAIAGRLGGGLFRLTTPAGKLEVVLGFRAERLQAQTLLRAAQEAQRSGRPGAALDGLRELARKLPMDSEVLAQGASLRGELMAQQAEALGALQRELDEAKFFETRGSYARVIDETALLTERFGAHNLEDEAAVAALRDAAQQRLSVLDAADHGAQRSRLDALQKALAESQQGLLAAMVQQYIGVHLPAVPPAGGSGSERKSGGN
jgi:pSer/pThr/pTyr-binding forkhead associated (FHA) protein